MTRLGYFITQPHLVRLLLSIQVVDAMQCSLTFSELNQMNYFGMQLT